MSNKLFDTIKAVFNGSDTVAAGAHILNTARQEVDKLAPDDLLDHVLDNLPETVIARGRQSVLFQIAYHAVSLVRLLWGLRQKAVIGQ